MYDIVYTLQNGDFKRIGTLVGMSIIHGGSGYPFFAPSLFQYLCGHDVCTITPSLEEAPDHELKMVLVKVCTCTHL